MTTDPSARRRSLGLALASNAVLLVLEVGGGLVFRSLALLADGAHLLTDVVALAVALIVQRLATRPATSRHTFGLQRAEVLGAQANAVLLLAASAAVVVEASRRLLRGEDVSGAGVAGVAALGLAVNVASAVLLARHTGRGAQESLNMRGAFLHMAADAAGSAAALGAGIGIVVWGAKWLDPAASIAISALVVRSAWRLLVHATHVLMEGAPRHLDAHAVEQFLRADPAVAGIHHLHLWNLASDVPALSAHVVLAREMSLHDAQLEGDRLRSRVLDRFGISHTTFELECHACSEEGRSPSAS